MSGSTRPRTPGSTSAARHRAAPVVAYRRVKTVGTHQPKFSGLNTFKVGFTRYLCTSPAFVPTHRLACYQTRRKARYWARGARLPRRDSHPLEHATLPGRTVPGFAAGFARFRCPFSSVPVGPGFIRAWNEEPRKGGTHGQRPCRREPAKEGSQAPASRPPGSYVCHGSVGLVIAVGRSLAVPTPCSSHLVLDAVRNEPMVCPCC